MYGENLTSLRSVPVADRETGLAQWGLLRIERKQEDDSSINQLSRKYQNWLYLSVVVVVMVAKEVEK